MNDNFDYDLVRKEILKSITRTSKIGSETRIQSLLFALGFVATIITITKLFL